MNLKNKFINTIDKINLNKLAVIFVSFVFIMVGFIVLVPQVKAIHPDLNMEKSDSPDPVFAGEYLTYTLNVTNIDSKWTAEDVNVTDILPSEATFNYANPAPSGNNNQIYWWNFSSIAPGGTEIITINVTVDIGTTGIITNFANVTNYHPEYYYLNNEDNETTNILSPFPVAVNDTASTPEDTPVAINVTANDYDLDGTWNNRSYDCCHRK